MFYQISKYLFLSILLLFVSLPHVCSQITISGKVQNIQNEVITDAFVIWKDSLNATQIKGFVGTENGRYQIKIDASMHSICIEITRIGYIKAHKILIGLEPNKTYTQDFILEPQGQLEDIVLVSKKPPFEIKEDTVTFRVEAYKDGTERKIEDIIKKLPNTQVNEKTGEITYKGKSIETVRVDGDDLFGANYVTGTRNINVEAVEAVEALENYSDNPLLKGIEEGEKVALNLKLSKKGIDLSGNMQGSLGILDNDKIAQDNKITLLGIGKKSKGFAVASYNNVGINETPYDNFSERPTVEQLKDLHTFVTKLIENGVGGLSFLDTKRINVNDAFYANYNHLLKPFKKTTLKVNLFYNHDKIVSKQSNETSNLINTDKFLTSDIFDNQKKVQQYQANIEMRSSISKKSAVEIKSKINKNQTNNYSNILQNATKNYDTKLNTKNMEIKNSLLYTWRVSEKKAFQISLNQSLNDVPQNYHLNPSLTDTILYVRDRQYSNFKKDILQTKVTLLANTKYGKYNFVIGFQKENDFYKSNLNSYIDETNTQSINDFSNNFTYKKISYYNKFSYNMSIKNLKNIKLVPYYNLKYLSQSLIQNNEIKEAENLYIEYGLGIKQKVSNISFLTYNFGHTRTPYHEQYMFTNNVYTSNRDVLSNTPHIALQNQYNLGTSFILSDLSNQFSMNIGANQIIVHGNYLSNFSILSNRSLTQRFFLSNTTKNSNINFHIEKYMDFCKILLKLESAYAIFKYNNLVNNSELRDNISTNWSSSLLLRSVFDGKINFENTFTVNYLKSKSSLSTQNNNISINNFSKIIVKCSKKWVIFFTGDYYLPDNTKFKESIVFLDFLVRYSFASNKYGFSLVGRNLMNKKYFKQVNVSDYASSVYEYNILPRSLIAIFSYSF